MLEADKHFYKFMTDAGIGDFYRLANGKHSFELNEDEIVLLMQKDLVFDASKGGLVKGAENNYRGGIFLLIPSKGNRFTYHGIIEPLSYISSIYSYSNHKRLFHELEASVENFLDFKPLKVVPTDCKIIDTGKNVFAFCVLHYYTQFIFSRMTVNKHINRIMDCERNY